MGIAKGHAEKLEGRMSKIARAFSRRNVRVVLSGTSCYTDTNNTIYLPANADYLKDDDIQVLEGMLDHEVAHQEEEQIASDLKIASPMDLMKGKPARESYLINVFEDIRIEIERSKRYFGIGQNLNHLHQVMLERCIKPAVAKGDFDRWALIGCGIISRARGFDSSWLPPEFAELVDNLGDVVDRARKSNSAKTSALLAKDVIKRIGSMEPPPPPPSKKGDKNEKGEEKDNKGKEGKKEGKDGSDQKESGKTDSKSKEDKKEGKDNKKTKGSEDSKGSKKGEEKSEEPKGSDESDDSEPNDGEGSEGNSESEGEEGDKSDKSESDKSEPKGEKCDKKPADPSKSEDSKAESGNDGDPSECGGDQSEAEDDNGPADPSGDASGPLSEAARELAKELGPDEGEVADPLEPLRKELTKAAEYDIRVNKRHIPHPRVQARDTIEPLPKRSVAEYEAALHRVRPTVAGLRSKMLAMLRSLKERRPMGDQERGRLDTPSLYSLRMGNKRIFAADRKEQDINTVVELLVDESGSMMESGSSWGGPSKMDVARDCALAMGETLSQVGIPFACHGFQNDWQDGLAYREDLKDKLYNRYERMLIHEAKGFDEPWRSARTKFLSLKYGTNNSDGEFVEWAAKQLIARPERRKLLFVFSDGYPYAMGDTDLHAAHLKKAVDKAVAAGVEVFGVGIMSKSVQNFYPTWEVVNKLTELAPAMFRMLRKHLLKGLSPAGK